MELSIRRQSFLMYQLETCRKIPTPGGSLFMPIDGICWSCRGDVIEAEIADGNDGSRLVTGCRLCLRTYCD